jgi:hypothetical protein
VLIRQELVHPRAFYLLDDQREDVCGKILQHFLCLFREIRPKGKLVLGRALKTVPNDFVFLSAGQNVHRLFKGKLPIPDYFYHFTPSLSDRLLILWARLHAVSKNLARQQNRPPVHLRCLSPKRSSLFTTSEIAYPPKPYKAYHCDGLMPDEASGSA